MSSVIKISNLDVSRLDYVDGKSNGGYLKLGGKRVPFVQLDANVVFTHDDPSRKLVLRASVRDMDILRSLDKHFSANVDVYGKHHKTVVSKAGYDDTARLTLDKNCVIAGPESSQLEAGSKVRLLMSLSGFYRSEQIGSGLYMRIVRLHVIEAPPAAEIPDFMSDDEEEPRRTKGDTW